MQNGSALISETYQQQQRELHESEVYGVIGEQYAPIISAIVNNLGILHLLDYGCGKARLIRSLRADHKFKYQAYDPGVEEFSGDPVPAELVVCCDVLEHIEPEKLDNVLDHLAELTEVVLFATIDTGEAIKELSDGRNAHLIQQPISWWLPKLWDRFDLQTVQVTSERSFYVIAYAKPKALIEPANGEKI